MPLPRLAPDWEIWRLRLLLLVMLTALGVLVYSLWVLQVKQGSRYRSDQQQQSVRRVRLPGTRGEIYDRNRRPMAANRPSFAIALYLEELRRPGKWEKTIARVESTIRELSRRLGLESTVTREDIRKHIQRSLPLPFLVWRDVSDPVLARWAEQASHLPGVDIYPEPVRVYPAGALAGHILGYVGRADLMEDESNPFHYYLPEMAGRAGIERVYDEPLRGRAGGRIVRVDVSGYRHGDVGGRAPEAGSDLALTLDLRLQQLATNALADILGALVAIDPRNGEVLAMVSSPPIDSNDFVPINRADRWNELTSDPRIPLLNRATAGAYPPGSTFKPVTAIASLIARPASARESHHCPGYFMLGRSRFGCWDIAGHGDLAMSGAIRHSCNVYFYHTALASGHEPVVSVAQALGLGRRTGIDLDSDSAGILPSDAWKRREKKEGWRDGDTCNLAIGQGFLTTSPLQMAVVTAAFANGGRRVKPHLLQAVRRPGAAEFEAVPVAAPVELGWPAAAVKLVRDGMRDVVMAEDGTGRKARIPGVAISGKTGTAEFGSKGSGLKRGWMIAYAPSEDPRLAVAMVVEEAVSGGSTVAPRLQKFFAGAFGVALPAAPGTAANGAGGPG
jgi:penicillin-binding protein 2